MTLSSDSRILIISDTPDFADRVSKLLRSTGFEIKVRKGINPGNDMEEHDVIIMDGEMPSPGVSDVLKDSAGRPASPRIIVVSDDSDVDKAVKVMKKGAFHYFSLPVPEAEMKNLVEKALEAKKMDEENRSLKMELTLFKIIKTIATTLEMEKLLNLIMDAAMELTQADHGVFLLYREAGKAFEIQEIRGLSQDLTENGVFGFEHGTLGEFMDADGPILLEDLKAGRKPYRGGIGDAELKSVISSPIVARGTRVGLVLVGKSAETPRNFDDEEVRILELLVRETSDVIDNAFSFKQAKELTLKDDLTKAYNRRYFEKYVEEEIERAKRFGTKLSLIFMDMDNLKEVNDRYGHFMGSKALMEAAGRMIGAVRAIDKVVRYGGDEFCVVLPETGPEGAIMVAERLRDVISSRLFLTDETEGVALSGSFGVAAFPDHASNKDELVREADRAMYQVKEAAKDGVLMALMCEGKGEEKKKKSDKKS